MSDRQKDAQLNEQKDHQNAQVEDLDVSPEEVGEVKGGKVTMQDFHFTKKVDKASPSL